MRRPPTRVLVVAASLVVVAASILAVTASAQSGARANHGTRPFHLTKECPPSTMQGQIGDYCTVTSSNVAGIPVGTRSSMRRPPVRPPWTATSSSTPGPAIPRPAIAHSILRPASGGARCRAEPGGSTASVLVSTSRTWAGMTGPGTGRTGSATTTRNSDSGAQGRAPTSAPKRFPDERPRCESRQNVVSSTTVTDQTGLERLPNERLVPPLTVLA